jgi:hypothetical protein
MSATLSSITPLGKIRFYLSHIQIFSNDVISCKEVLITMTYLVLLFDSGDKLVCDFEEVARVVAR